MGGNKHILLCIFGHFLSVLIIQLVLFDKAPLPFHKLSSAFLGYYAIFMLLSFILIAPFVKFIEVAPGVFFMNLIAIHAFVFVLLCYIYIKNIDWVLNVLSTSLDADEINIEDIDNNDVGKPMTIKDILQSTKHRSEDDPIEIPPVFWAYIVKKSLAIPVMRCVVIGIYIMIQV